MTASLLSSKREFIGIKYDVHKSYIWSEMIGGDRILVGSRDLRRHHGANAEASDLVDTHAQRNTNNDSTRKDNEGLTDRWQHYERL